MCLPVQKASAKSRRVIRKSLPASRRVKSPRLKRFNDLTRRRHSSSWSSAPLGKLDLSRDIEKLLFGGIAKSHRIALAEGQVRGRLLTHENNYIIGLNRRRFFSLAQPTWAGPRGGGGWRRPLWRWRPCRRDLLVAALAPRQASTAAAFEQHRLSAVHTLPAEVSADQVSHLDSIMVVIPHVCRAAAGIRPLSRSGPRRPYVSRSAAATRQPNRVNSIAARAVRQIADFDRNKSSAKSRRRQLRAETGFRIRGRRPLLTDRLRQTVSRSSETMPPRGTHANWHRDWDRHHSHFHNHKVFVFLNGFWWGLDPWDYPCLR